MYHKSVGHGLDCLPPFVGHGLIVHGVQCHLHFINLNCHEFVGHGLTVRHKLMSENFFHMPQICGKWCPTNLVMLQ
jgi:hypothetical protein